MVVGYKSNVRSWEIIIITEGMCELEKNYIEIIKKPFNIN